MYFSIQPKLLTGAGRLSWDLDEVPFPVALLNEEGSILACNQRVRRAAGLDPGKAPGGFLWDWFWVPLRPGESEQLRGAVLTARSNRQVVRCALGNCTLIPMTGANGGRSVLAAGLIKPDFCNVLVDGSHPQDDFQQLERVASHNLLEPLRGIHTSAQLLGRMLEGALDASGRALLADLRRNVERMGALLDGLSEYAAADDSRFELLDVNECVAEAAERLVPPLPPTGALSDSPLPIVTGQRAGLITVFEHLLRNANQNRFPNRALSVVITARRAGGWWLFQVTDNGIGIDPLYHETVFEIFARLSPHENGRLGLGLAICRRIVSGWAGRIWLDGVPGQGVTVTFSIRAGSDSIGSVHDNGF
ncbi:MAG: ATP-binding protein [Bryobacteraceae bacterium]